MGERESFSGASTVSRSSSDGFSRVRAPCRWFLSHPSLPPVCSPPLSCQKGTCRILVQDRMIPLFAYRGTAELLKSLNGKQTHVFVNVSVLLSRLMRQVKSLCSVMATPPLLKTAESALCSLVETLSTLSQCERHQQLQFYDISHVITQRFTTKVSKMAAAAFLGQNQGWQEGQGNRPVSFPVFCGATLGSFMLFRPWEGRWFL